MTHEDLRAIEARADAAWNELSRLCKAGQWRMTIPVDEGRDSDRILGRTITDVPALVAEVARLRDENARLREAGAEMNHYVCQTLGKARGFPRYCDDQKAWPDTTPEDGVCVGEHTAETLAAEAALEIERLRAHLDKAESALESCDMATCPQCGEWVDAAELSPSGDYEPVCEACGDSATHQCECGFRTSVPDEFECCPQCGKEPAAFMARAEESNDGK